MPTDHAVLKAPQDHLPKGGAAAADDIPPAGWELLKPIDEVPVWEQTELIGIVQPLLADLQPDGTDREGVSLASVDVKVVGDLAKQLQNYAVDPEAYVRFVSGRGALERAINLAIAYVNQMGESERSTDS